MQHHFKFKRGDLELEFAGERAFVEAQAALYMPLLAAGVLAAPAPAPEAPAEDAFPRVSPDFRPRRNVTLADFITLKAATSPADLVVVAAYYMEKYMQQESFTPEELHAQLRDVPAWGCQVVDEVLPLGVLQGYVEELRDGRYTLTYKGQTYVRDGLE